MILEAYLQDDLRFYLLKPTSNSGELYVLKEEARFSNEIEVYVNGIRHFDFYYIVSTGNEVIGMRFVPVGEEIPDSVRNIINSLRPQVTVIVPENMISPTYYTLR